LDFEYGYVNLQLAVSLDGGVRVKYEMKQFCFVYFGNLPSHVNSRLF